MEGADFLIIGRDILRCTDQNPRKYPTWSFVGNTYNVEVVSSDLLRRLWLQNHNNLHIQISGGVKFEVQRVDDDAEKSQMSQA